MEPLCTLSAMRMVSLWKPVLRSPLCILQARKNPVSFGLAAGDSLARIPELALCYCHIIGDLSATF